MGPMQKPVIHLLLLEVGVCHRCIQNVILFGKLCRQTENFVPRHSWMGELEILLSQPVEVQTVLMVSLQFVGPESVTKRHWWRGSN